MILTLLVSIMVFSRCAGQDKKAQNAVLPAKDSVAGANSYGYSFKAAHPNAQVLMKEDFYWSTIEETGPFGSDDGWEAAQGFREWRANNKTGNVINYLRELMAGWNYPYFDWKEMDTTKIKAYIMSGTNLDEAAIQERIRQLKAVSEKYPDTGRKLDDIQLRRIVLTSARGMNGIFLLGQDNAIIGTAFAQLALEGKIDRELKELASTAIQRQILPVLINRYDDVYRDERKEQLTKMLGVVKRAK